LRNRLDGIALSVDSALHLLGRDSNLQSTG
jgi:hypothetical protein